MSEKQEDNRDIWEKVVDLLPIPVTALAGGLLGRGMFRRVARKNLPDGPRGVQPGDRIITDEGVKIASKKDAERFARFDADDVSRQGRKGALLGGSTGAVVGATISADRIKRKRRK